MKRIREPFGKAGLIVAVVALVAAMVGGAYAADSASTSGKRHHKKAHHKKKKSKYVITNKKQIKPNVLKQLKGNAGAAGPAGPQGPAGAKGDNGSNGSNGLDGEPGKNGEAGASGKSVLVGEETSCAEGGIVVEVEDSGAPHEICNGEEGAEGPEGALGTAGTTLPVSATETGAWSVGAYFGPTKEPAEAISTPAWAPISFTIPLAEELAESNVHYVEKGANPPPACENSEHAGAAGPANPEATSGNLCVYASQETPALKGGSFGIHKPGTVNAAGGASKVGALLEWILLEEGFQAWGTWAVTG